MPHNDVNYKIFVQFQVLTLPAVVINPHHDFTVSGRIKNFLINGYIHS